MLGCQIEEGPNLDFSKDKVVFLHNYFVIRFKSLLEVKLSFKSVLENIIHAQGLGGKRREEGEGGKTKNSLRTSRSLSEIRRGDPD